MTKGSLRIFTFVALATAALAQGGPGNGSAGTQGNTGQGNGSSGGFWNQAPDLPNYTGGNLVDLIVQFKQPPSASDLAQIQQYWDAADKNSASTTSGQNRHDFTSTIKAFRLKVPPSAVKLISAMPNVAYVSPVRPVQKSLDVVDATVNAPMAWAYGLNGSGVGVAVIDSGIYADDDLAGWWHNSRVVYNQSFVDGATPTDQFGHGTHVAGIIGSDGSDSIGPNMFRTFRGVAPNVNLVNLKVLDANGNGDEGDVIAAIQQAIQLQNTYNIRVINLSLGRPVIESYTLDPLCQAVEAAWKAGIVVVVAAGNAGRDNSMGTNGYGTIQSPGNDPYVITVGATDTNGTYTRADDKVASYSSKGPTLIDHIVKPDLVAPGNNVVSILAPNTTLASLYPNTLINYSYYESGWVMGKSRDYYRLSGTSMATPVVAGAAALLIQKNPSLTPDQVKARLMKTATKVLPPFNTAIDSLTLQSFSYQADIFTVGAGYLDINAALASTDLATLPALSPAVALDPTTKQVYLVRNYSLCWGDSLTWGDLQVFGSSVFNGLLGSGADIIWGDSVAWGDLTSPAFQIIWGDTVNPNSHPQAMSANDSDQ